MAQIIASVNFEGGFSLEEIRRDIRLLTEVYALGKERWDICELVDLDYDGENLHVTVELCAEDVKSFLEALSPDVQGDLLIELFSPEEREQLGKLENLGRPGLEVEVATWYPDRSEPEYEVVT